jgi:hypothetical protein
MRPYLHFVEISELLRIDRWTLKQMIRVGDFPEATGVSYKGQAWGRALVEKWGKKHPRPEKSYPPLPPEFEKYRT